MRTVKTIYKKVPPKRAAEFLARKRSKRSRCTRATESFNPCMCRHATSMNLCSRSKLQKWSGSWTRLTKI